MGQPRAGKKRVVVISSDEDENSDGVEDIMIEDESDQHDDVAPENKRKEARFTDVSKGTKYQLTPSTSQSSQSSQKSKPAVKTATAKPKGAIYSFFNAVTQKQIASQPSASSQRAPEPPKRAEIDDTIDEEDVSVTVADGSRTSMAMRKRKIKNNDQLSQSNGQLSLPSTQKFRKLSHDTKVAVRPQIEDRRPWTEQYGPKDISELAVHKKKVADVRKLLDEALSPRARPRLVVLKGAAGTGKTATVQLLAKEMGVEVKSWHNPGGVDVSSENYTSASSQFEDFILRSRRFAGLDVVSGDRVLEQSAKDTDKDISKPQLLLVEEFPNTFTKSSTVLQSFRSTIQQYLASRLAPGQKPTPVVMIISETLLSTSTAAADSFTAHRLLGPAILTHPLTAEIEFNAVAPTILVKALELVVIKEARKSGRRTTPGPQVLKQIAETGDIRSAIYSLEFLCLRGDNDDSWSAKVAFTKGKGRTANRETPLTKQEEEALKMITNRESTLGIFHSVGKVVYNKRLPPSSARELAQPPAHLILHRRPKVPETDPEALLTELGTDTSTFVAALHENYTLSCAQSMREETIDSLNGCLDALSDADMLAPDRCGAGTRTYSGSAADNLRQDDMAFQVAVRGMLFALPYPVKRDSGSGAVRGRGDAFRMFYPTSLKIWKRREELEAMVDLIVSEYESLLGAARTGPREKGEGVESWRRNQDMASAKPNINEAADEGAESIGCVSNAAKYEMLLERLPFMARILPSRPSLSPHLMQRLQDITSVSGTGAPDNEDEADDEDDVDVLGDEWTDRPDADGEGNRLKSKRKGKRNGRTKDTEGGGLHIPVEHDIEKLVLSDDDIED